MASTPEKYGDAETTEVNTQRRQRPWSRAYLMQDVNPDLSTWPLVAYCFMTGWLDVVAFSAVFGWAGFQTGNSAQLAIALGRLFEGPAGARDTSFHLPDQLALTSLLTFICGGFLGRVGDRIGAKTRAWLFLGTFIQTLLTMIAAISIHFSGQGSIANSRGALAWSDASAFACLGLISASLGLQGIMGKRLNTQFTTTVVLTTVWCELVCEPQLFSFRRVKSRDHKVAAIASLFIGAFLCRAVLQVSNSAIALGVATAIRGIVAVSWIFVPAKPVNKPTKAHGAAPGSKEGGEGGIRQSNVPLLESGRDVSRA